MSARQDTHRRARDAATRFQRAVACIRYDAANADDDGARWLAGFEATTLLLRVLDAADDLVDALADDPAEYEHYELERHARVLFERLRARRLAARLEQVEGRTPEEAAAFLAKARELREQA